MTDHAHDSGDPNDIINTLRAAINNDADAIGFDDDTVEEALLDAFAHGNLSFSAAVTAAADQLIEPVPVSPAARSRFIAAAERALAERRVDHGLLPTALQAARRRKELDLSTVSETVGVDIERLETGDDLVTSLEADTVATWIVAVDASLDLASDALRRSLATSEAEAFRPAAGRDTVELDVEGYVAAVRDLVVTKRNEGDSR